MLNCSSLCVNDDSDGSSIFSIVVLQGSSETFTEVLYIRLFLENSEKCFLNSGVNDFFDFFGFMVGEFKTIVFGD